MSHITIKLQYIELEFVGYEFCVVVTFDNPGWVIYSNAKLHAKLKTWCIDHQLSLECRGTQHFYFSQKDHAMAFILRWDGAVEDWN